MIRPKNDTKVIHAKTLNKSVWECTFRDKFYFVVWLYDVIFVYTGRSPGYDLVGL